MDLPSAVEILQISIISGGFECYVQVLLDLGYGFEVVRDLETLHICSDIRPGRALNNLQISHTLHDPGELMVLVEVEQLLACIQR